MMQGSSIHQDPVSQMNTFRGFVSILIEVNAKDENKLKAAQELAEELEVIIASPQYPTFLETAIKNFLKLLQDGEPQFIAEHNVQQLRKLILEIIHRLPTNEHLKPYVKNILQVMFKLLEIDNEENVLVCLRIIIELHKHYRPPFSPEIQNFLHFVKKIYQDLPSHLTKIFEPKQTLKVKDISEMNINAVLLETFAVATVQTEKKNPDGTSVTYTVIPKAELSLKVLAELPIIVVLMYQLFKANVHQEVAEFIPLIMSTISQQPPPQTPLTKEVFVDFMASQIKTLSFLAYIVRLYQENVNNHSGKLAKGMLGLLIMCPPEVAHLRKELLIAARHILATDLRDKFVPYLDQFFDENVLIGSGWTAYDSLRPLAYSTLADLVHHVRTLISLKDLAAAANLFSRNVHDESLPTSIQTMSCKLLLNLVECIRTKDSINGRELLMKMLEVFVLKFKTIAKLQLPVLIQKSKTTESSAASGSKSSTFSIGLLDCKEEKPKFGFPSGPANPYTVNDCKGLVKTLVGGVKTITWGIGSCKVASSSQADIGTVLATVTNGNIPVSTTTTAAQATQNKQFQAKETLVFIRLVKYAMQALDIYTLTSPPPQQQQSGGSTGRPGANSTQQVRSKDEKEVLEHFAGVFQMMNPLTFKEVFSTTIEYVVERIHKNNSLQVVANSFLAFPSTSAIFATILVEYLLARMEEMGHNMERSNLYLKLFKMVFGSVSLFPAENEQMLKPNLHQIVNRSMMLALTAREPYNYFLLLRALFRSIGGGSHDQLYQEFLPLLPSLLQGLNSLQSGLHKQHMKDLFVELCLTVPVRLSSLLPYLPMLMDPLVSALNGSQTLVSQGLRTLELCVDNLQPDFLYDHISPVRAELMHALWKTLRNPTDNVAQVAFRVLGKFGGGNRKMMVEPQKLEYNLKDGPGPCLTVYFEEHKNAISLPTIKIVETAVAGLRSSATDSTYRGECWNVVRGFIIAHMQLDDSTQICHLFTHPSFTSSDFTEVHSLYKSTDEETRSVMIKALSGMFFAAANRGLKALPFMACVVRHCMVAAIAQQLAVGNSGGQVTYQGMDCLVVVDALAVVLSHEDKDLCRPALLAISLMLDTAAAVLGSRARVQHLSYLEYLADKIASLCYERAWYAKLGGCMAIQFVFDRLPLAWVLTHVYAVVKALFFVLMDLTGEVSSGALDLARFNLERLLTVCAAPPADPSLTELQQKALHDVIHDLVRQVTSPNTTVRQQAMNSLRLLARVSGQSVTEIMEPHKNVLADMIPPKKHLLRHQPVTAQIGIMDGNTFCTSLEPRLFTFDLSINEHKTFFNEIMTIGEHDDQALQRIPCYKSVTNFLPLRQSALRALAACHYLTDKASNIFEVLLRAVQGATPELQDLGFECLESFTSHVPADLDLAHRVMKPFLQALADYRSLSLPVVRRLSYLTRLFPTSFKEKLCEQLLQHLRKWLEVYVKTKQRTGTTSEELKTCLTILQIFHQIPAATSKYVELLIVLVLKTEKVLSVEAGSPFRPPLVAFLRRFPAQTVEFLLESDMDDQIARFCLYIMKGDQAFRDYLQNQPHKLAKLLGGGDHHQFLGVGLVHALVRHNPQWLAGQQDLAAVLRSRWVDIQSKQLDYTRWKEPKMLAKCLLNYFQHHPNQIELLFQLLRAFTGRFIRDFEFLRTFLEVTVAQTYSIEWKRRAFFKFVEVFRDEMYPHELKAKILQYIIIPLFSTAFERGEGERLIGGPPAPDQDPPDNVISVFITKIIDPENPFATSDLERILLLQFSCLLVEKASNHIHDAANKRQGNKLRRLMTFAWPCLLAKSCVDPATKYHGHLLLAHIIAKFAIHKRIVLQVFHSLLKAHAVEARGVVRQALEVLTPAMPARMEDGNTLLTHWTKKIIVEEGHTLAQLVHMLQLLVRHYKVYYPVRHHLLAHMVASVQRLGFTPNSQMEHKKLAVDLAEVIISWEHHRTREEGQESDSQQQKRARNPSGTKSLPDVNKPVDKAHSEAVVNFLLRMACQGTVCQVNDASAGSPGEGLSRRCFNLMQGALAVWPSTELRLAWMDKLLMESGQSNYGNVCMALEVLGHLVGHLPKESVLASFRPLQRGIVNCMNCQNNKVIRYVHGLMTALMKAFPAESNAGCKYEELECLYTSIYKVVYEGFTNYEKGHPLSVLFGPLMVLKAACTHTPCFIDRLITPFMRVLQKMTKDHISPTASTPEAGTSGVPVVAATPVTLNVDLLILSLDLVKNRVGVMGQEMRKSFIGSILVGLIEKSPEVRVVKAVTKMVEDWVKSKSAFSQNMCPTMREKSILLVKMMQYIEKRFPDEMELNGLFLEIVNYVYRDEGLKLSEIQVKLEPAFMAGLRCVQPSIRAKFFEVLDSSMKRRLHERLMYITVMQNWETMGPHFWIQQCLELVLATAARTVPVQASSQARLPSLSSLLGHDTFIKSEPMDTGTIDEQEQLEKLEDKVNSTTGPVVLEEPKPETVQILAWLQSLQLENLREYRTGTFLGAAAQLAHWDSSLAHWLWVALFPRLWRILQEKQQNALATELIPFISSGSHVIQKESHPSACGTFVEALCHCNPPLALQTTVLKYIGKSHNLWHRICLLLESTQSRQSRQSTELYDFDTTASNHETQDALAEMYSVLKEEDLFVGLWQKRARYQETITALSYEQQGCFEHALQAYEVAIEKARADQANGPVPRSMESEYRLLEDHWIRVNKELGEWNVIIEYSQGDFTQYSHHILDSAWREGNWALMSSALLEMEGNAPKEMGWKVSLYHGYLALCQEDFSTRKEDPRPQVDRCVEVANNLCIREWRRYPPLVSHMHITLLQAAQLIMELQEAAQIHAGFLPPAVLAAAPTTGTRSATGMHDMKAIVKTWRNRLPVVSDDLSHWSDILAWRQHHYRAMVVFYEGHGSGASSDNNAMMGVHASAQSIIHLGKVARKQGLPNVCLDHLNRIHTILSVPIVDCFQKIRQQIKCYLQASPHISKAELQDGLEIIESTNLKYFSKDMSAEFYALKGLFLMHLGQSEEANRTFSAATQMQDTLVRAWALWGDYNESLFTRDRWTTRQISLGVNTIVCFLHACRHQYETKSRKYLAKVLWLLTYDDNNSQLAEAVEKYHVGVPAAHWLPWVPQLLTCLVRPLEGKPLLNLISQVGRFFPQAVYFPIRTLYLTLKIEQRERHKANSAASGSGDQPVGENAAGGTAAIKATPSMWRCSRIMQLQRDYHPTILSSLEGIVDQMVWFRENWYEEVLRQLRQGLAKCYAVSFENRVAVSETTVTPHTLNFVKKLVATFGVGIENVASGAPPSSFSSAASESLARRAQATAQDPVFQKMKVQFTQDFDFSTPEAMKLHNLINKLKKWIKILEAKTKHLPSSFLIEERCRFLSNFTQQTADIEMPGELLMPKPIQAINCKVLQTGEPISQASSINSYHSHYCIKIARFMPRVEIVQKHNTAARRLYIRGHNGKICPYLIVNDACLRNPRREERVLQILRMANHCLSKQKETARRYLHFTTPRVVAVSPQMRLIEDNPSSISLLDIYKQRCAKRGIEYDAPILRYYERLATVQARGSQASHQVLRDILKDVQNIMVPRELLREWAAHTYPDPPHYWAFRRQLGLQLALAGLVEYALHLTRLNPDMMYLHQDSGLLNVAYYRFDLDDTSGELDSNRPVPFRLTPNISEFLTPMGVSGPLTGAMIATARCLVQPNFKVPALLRAVLRDEVIAWHKKRQDDPQQPNGDMEGEMLVNMVSKAVTAIMNRLQSLAAFEAGESKVSTLVAAANSHDNLCRMDPAWHPWL